MLFGFAAFSMGNVAVSLFRDTRYDCFNTLTEDDVAAIWEKEKYASRDSKRHRYVYQHKLIRLIFLKIVIFFFALEVMFTSLCINLKC